MDSIDPNDEPGRRALDACVEHALWLLTVQQPVVKERKFDFVPAFEEMVTDLFLVGAMWRFGEQFNLAVNARDRAFVCLIALLVKRGMSFRKAKKRAALLYNDCSRDAKGDDNLAIKIGYEVGLKDGALAAVFDTYRNDPSAAGAPFRFVRRFPPIAAVLGIAAMTIAMLLDRSVGEALGVGIVIAISTFTIGLVMFSQMRKSK